MAGGLSSEALNSKFLVANTDKEKTKHTTRGLFSRYDFTNRNQPRCQAY